MWKGGCSSCNSKRSLICSRLARDHQPTLGFSHRWCGCIFLAHTLFTRSCETVLCNHIASIRFCHLPPLKSASSSSVIIYCTTLWTMLFPSWFIQIVRRPCQVLCIHTKLCGLFILQWGTAWGPRWRGTFWQMSTTHLSSSCTMVRHPEASSVFTFSSDLQLSNFSCIAFESVAFQTEGKLYLILDFLRGGDLFTRLSKEVRGIHYIVAWDQAFFSFIK